MGGMEIRRCWTLSDLDYLTQTPLWVGLKTLVMVQSERRCNGQTTTENRFFISSLPSHATWLMHAVRIHWSIENSLPGLLEVSLRADACWIRRDFAPQSLALLRPLVLICSLRTLLLSVELRLGAKRQPGVSLISSSF